jgi:exosortase
VSTPASILPSGSRPDPARRPAAAAPPAIRPVPVDESLFEGVRRRLGEWVRDMGDADQRTPWLIIALLTAALIYSYWPGLLNARSSWDNPQYSHGWIVPICAAALIFWWRQPIGPVNTLARLVGLGMMIGSFAVRLICAHYSIVTIDMYTFVPALAGAFLMAGGWGLFKWAWAPIAMLIFMYPLPDEATRYLLGPLQTLATIMSTYALQTFGLDAYREGNKIILGESQVLGVVDACSGLRMLTIFVWLALMIVLVGGGEWWDNLIIAASAIPIALIVNATRITVTGVMYTINPEMAEKIFHDWAGYFMMPMALGLLFLEQAVLRKMVVTEELVPGTVVAGRPATAAAGASKPTRAASLVPIVNRPDAPGKSG